MGADISDTGAWALQEPPSTRGESLHTHLCIRTEYRPTPSSDREPQALGGIDEPMLLSNRGVLNPKGERPEQGLGT